MIQAVLFDLDGTLLDVDMDVFLADYFALLGPLLADLIGSGDARSALGALMAATEEMATNHPDRTNKAIFDEAFLRLTGVDLDDPSAASVVDAFYAEQFPGLRKGHKPREGGLAAVEAAREAGVALALATNPIFPRAAIACRAEWAGVSLDVFDHVTTYETSRACKPSLMYFRDIASQLNVDTTECLMIGDDELLDMPAAECGMQTLYVGQSLTHAAALDDVAGLLAGQTL